MIPIFFQFTYNDTALEASDRLLPFIFLIVFAVIGNYAILSEYGYYMPWYTQLILMMMLLLMILMFAMNG